jgi:hypothetical protein
MFAPRLECFYNDGTNEHYVGHIRQFHGGFGPGFSVHFTEYEYPEPPGVRRSIQRIRLQTGVPDAEADYGSDSSVKKKEPSIYSKWGRGYERNKLGFVAEKMESEEDKREQSEQEDEEEDEESKGSDEELIAQDRMARVIRKYWTEAYEAQEKKR